MPTFSEIASRMDQLYEYDREPVAPGQLKPWSQFAGLFAGEHVAGTEFVIGAFFVLHGVHAGDLLLGLLIGNVLAVLSWTFVCAPIATSTRLTVYWYVRKIAGPGLTAVYNVANAILYCILAGAMIAVSATAVGLALGIPTPALTDMLPNSFAWVLLTFAIGISFLVLAILGFEKLSQFAEICSPWMFAMFIAGAIALLPALGVHPNLDNLWHVLQSRVWTGVASPGQDQFHLWHIVFFAWFCNLAMHVGLSDMAIFRYARHWSYGLLDGVRDVPRPHARLDLFRHHGRRREPADGPRAHGIRSRRRGRAPCGDPGQLDHGQPDPLPGRARAAVCQPRVAALEDDDDCRADHHRALLLFPARCS